MSFRPRHSGLRSLSLSLLLIASLGLYAESASAQLGGLGGAVKKGLGGAVLPDLAGKQPITTSLTDAKYAVDSLDNFTPRDDFRPMTQLTRTETGGFIIQNGAWAFEAQSYCLKAGTHGPGRGDGYLFAPTDGPAEAAVESIVRNSVQHPDIKQTDIQVLLWAIIARQKIEDMPRSYQVTAARLLTPQQIATLNRTAFDLIPDQILERAIAQTPPAIRAIVQAEADLRKLLVDPTASFDQLERVAVLTGAVGLGPGSRNVPSGRWSLHPDGYYVRYLPDGYSRTIVQIWVPQGSPAIGKTFDPATHIAMPGNTAKQRLIQSGRAYRSS